MRQIAVRAERRVSIAVTNADGPENLPGPQRPAAALIGRPSCFVKKESEKGGEMCELVRWCLASR